MNFAISLFAIAIAYCFVNNLNEIMEKIKNGKKVNKLSVLATSTLIFHFACLSLYFIINMSIIILISEVYMLIVLLYLLYRSKQKEKREKKNEMDNKH
jgi:1,4-dihydroxy-2-naphthoate octaprenyltransferase